MNLQYSWERFKDRQWHPFRQVRQEHQEPRQGSPKEVRSFSSGPEEL